MSNLKKILMVDDDGDLREALADQLVLTEEFDELIRSQAGNRGAFDAILSAWLPEERAKFMKALR